MSSDFRKLGNKFWLPIVLAGVAAIGMLVGYRLDDEYVDSSDDLLPVTETIKPGKIEELIKFVDAKYVDEVDTEDLTESTMRFILSQLDPHSSYFTPAELKRYQEQISGQFDGLGVELHFIRDTLSVFYVYPGSPAKKSGIKAGDRILRINDQDVHDQEMTDLDIETIIKNLKSKQVTLKVISSYNSEEKDLSVELGKFKINSISSAYMVDDSIGYVKLERFTTVAYKEFMTAMGEMLEHQGMKHLIFDLRSNPGGVLREAIKILQELYVENDKLLLFTQGDNVPRREYLTHGKPFHFVDKIVILINHGSASASEVVAGAIQDTDRGQIIGETSYGKGLVQEHYKLRNGGELRLTIARYYTPSGRLIQRPYRSANEFNYVSDTADYRTNSGRTVHGSGGVEPDQIVYQQADYIEILDSLDIERSFEVIFDHYLMAHRVDTSYGLDAIIDQKETIVKKLYDDLLGNDKDRALRLEPNRHAIDQFLFASYAQIIGGDQISKKILTSESPIVKSGIEYIQSKKPIAEINLE